MDDYKIILCGKSIYTTESLSKNEFDLYPDLNKLIESTKEICNKNEIHKFCVYRSNIKSKSISIEHMEKDAKQYYLIKCGPFSIFSEDLISSLLLMLINHQRQGYFKIVRSLTKVYLSILYSAIWVKYQNIKRSVSEIKLWTKIKK